MIRPGALDAAPAYSRRHDYNVIEFMRSYRGRVGGS
jgi:hypothetical protein